MTEEDCLAEFDAATKRTPLTMKGYALQHLNDNGLCGREAVMVLKRFKDTTAGQRMNGRWHSEREKQPLILQTVLRLGVNEEALRWIDEHKPNHTARSKLMN